MQRVPVPLLYLNPSTSSLRFRLPQPLCPDCPTGSQPRISDPAHHPERCKRLIGGFPAISKQQHKHRPELVLGVFPPTTNIVCETYVRSTTLASFRQCVYQSPKDIYRTIDVEQVPYFSATFELYRICFNLSSGMGKSPCLKTNSSQGFQSQVTACSELKKLQRSNIREKNLTSQPTKGGPNPEKRE